MPGDPAYCPASMGNYLFSTPVLIDVLKRTRVMRRVMILAMTLSRNSLVTGRVLRL
jgi:hypothetical protein